MRSETTKGQTLAGALVLCAAFLGTAACNTGGEDDVNNGGGDSDSDATPDGGDGDAGDEDAGDEDSDSDTGTPERPYTAALVLSTDYQTGAYSRIALGDRTVEKEIDFVHSDASCRFDSLTDTPFILNRLDGDSVDVLDPETFEIEKEYSVEAGSNPYDIAVVSNKRAYITRFGTADLLIVKPMSGDTVGTVDLSDYADDDGLPEAVGAETLGGTVFVALQLLDQAGDWGPVSAGIVLVIDAETGEIADTVEATGGNIYDGPRYSDVLKKFVLTEAGSLWELDGGVEFLDPETKAVSGFVVTEETMGGDLLKALFVSETKGYALVGVPNGSGSDTQVVSFNPETGEKLEIVLDGDGWVYSDIALTPDGSELWVADGSFETPGIRIIDTSDDSESTDEPIDVGLPPSHICFTR